ncbi:GNAT family N-acetyltransferase [Candidatus Nitrosarchaeum limnium]|uniref:Acetyltransferase, GNAT family n=1 Tax=Candidatus Nitrosarchaeum limnium BG20 TaxID=859192 RepID=S2E785_9ARCH|nr:GNAT family protein [Candidatus Nitrosarchaeum limnium]EPA05336.1 acetyltransferase, GNAT family [Candidatus Nitrosarchaeum limnium BG20]
MNKLKISSKCEKKDFKNMLLGLSQKTLNDFTYFGKISKKNVEKIIFSELKDNKKIRFFIFLENELIGYSFLSKFIRKSKKHVCTYGIVIGDKWQGKGFGYQICKHMIETAWKKKFEKIWLTTYYDNKAALKVYKKLGFIVEGIFINEEKIHGKPRHVISMGLFKNNKNIRKTHQKIFKILN